MNGSWAEQALLPPLLSPLPTPFCPVNAHTYRSGWETKAPGNEGV